MIEFEKGCSTGILETRMKYTRHYAETTTQDLILALRQNPEVAEGVRKGMGWKCLPENDNKR